MGTSRLANNTTCPTPDTQRSVKDLFHNEDSFNNRSVPLSSSHDTNKFLKRTNSITATSPRTYSLKKTNSSSAASTRPIIHQNYSSTPRSIPPAYSSEASHYSASTSQSSSASHSTRHKLAIQSQKEPPKKDTAGRKIKDKAYFAFVLLPLSCWYTRGDKRLRALEDDEDQGKFCYSPDCSAENRSTIATEASDR
jgi:hypothetical protein